MKRYGPLHATSDGVVVGDPGRRNLLMDREWLTYRVAREVRQRVPWGVVEALDVELPTTRFRYPGVLSGLGMAVLVGLFQDDPSLDPEPGAVEIRTDGVIHRLTLDRHHVGGYWGPAVRGTQRMLDRFVRDPASRDLLRYPDELLRAVTTAARVSPGQER